MQIQSWNINGQGFHFGRQGLEQEETGVIFPSDSLFAAIISRMVDWDGPESTAEFLKPFLEGSPQFVLSSCFPRAGKLRFYPVPMIASTSVEPTKNNGPRPKDLKQVQYISEGLFRQLLAGNRLFDLYTQSVKLQRKTLLLRKDEYSGLPAALQNEGSAIWNVEKRPRVTLGRSAQNSNIYFTGRVSYAEECGLWFAVRWLVSDSFQQERLKSLLADLAVSGLGAERSSGFGVCDIEPGDEIELPDPLAQPWVSLSRYLPRSDELGALQAPYAGYRIERVGGWLSSPKAAGQRRRTINMLAEGAFLGPLDRQAPGQMVDVRPSYANDTDPLGHPVYRSGLALAVGSQAPSAGDKS